MKRIRDKSCNLVSGIAVTFLVIGIVTTFSIEDIFGQAADFFSNTQTSDARDGDPSGPGNTAQNNPGFNPCEGASATRSADGACTGSPSATSLLNNTNLGTVFQQAGPGAITDNMFGKVTVESGTSTTWTNCGATAADIHAVALADVLNCGNVRIAPGAQGMNVPVFPLPNSLSAVLSGNANQLADFCESGGNDCPDSASAQISAAHTGLNLFNEFVWNPTTSAVTTPFNCAAGTSADNVNFCAQQIMEQVSALSTPIGTLGGPGAGDQQVRVEVNFETVSTTNVLASMPAPFTVNISMRIVDPDMSGSGAGFTQNIGTPGGVGGQTFGTAGMTFMHNAAGPSGGTQVFTCTPGPEDVGCSSYPTGPSQTAGTQPADLP